MKKANDTIWPVTIEIERWDASYEQMQQAWEDWVKHDELTMSWLAWFLRRVCIPDRMHSLFAFHRVADMMLGRAVKKGLIVFDDQTGRYTLVSLDQKAST